jgi:hypothetical protein
VQHVKGQKGKLPSLLAAFDESIVQGNRKQFSHWVMDNYPFIPSAEIPDIYIPTSLLTTSGGKNTRPPIASAMMDGNDTDKDIQEAIRIASKQVEELEIRIMELQQQGANIATSSIDRSLGVCQVFMEPETEDVSEACSHDMSLRTSPLPATYKMDVTLPPVVLHEWKPRISELLLHFSSKSYAPSNKFIDTEDILMHHIDLRNLLMHMLLVAEERGFSLEVGSAALLCPTSEHPDRSKIGWEVLTYIAKHMPEGWQKRVPFYTLAGCVLCLPEQFRTAVMTTLLIHERAPELHLLAWISNPVTHRELYDMIVPSTADIDVTSYHTQARASDILTYIAHLPMFLEKHEFVGCSGGDVAVMYAVSIFLSELFPEHYAHVQKQQKHYHVSEYIRRCGWYADVLKGVLRSETSGDTSKIINKAVLQLRVNEEDRIEFSLFSTRVCPLILNAIYTKGIRKALDMQQGSAYGRRYVMDRNGFKRGIRVLGRLDFATNLEYMHICKTGLELGDLIDAGILMWRVFLRMHTVENTNSLKSFMAYYRKGVASGNHKYIDDCALAIVDSIQKWSSVYAPPDTVCTLNFTAYAHVLSRARVAASTLSTEKIITDSLEKCDSNSLLYNMLILTKCS